MATIVKEHARSGPEGLVYWAASRNEPAFEAIIRGHISSGMLREKDRDLGFGIGSLVKATTRRLEMKDGNKEKYNYTRKHSLEVGYYSYIMACEAKNHNIPEAEEIDPKICFAGGFGHDIGKTFLPMALVVKELGIDMTYFCLFEGARMNDLERRVLRDEHLYAGTRYVRLFEGNENMNTILDMVGLHHVMYDGKDSMYPSYPKHKVGRLLPLHSRIAKTADFLSAVLPRHYRNDNWVHGLHTSIAYAITVAGTELDPFTVRSFITGTHNVSPEETDILISRLRHPLGNIGVSMMGEVKKHVLDTIYNDDGFIKLTKTKNLEKILQYKIKIEECAGELGAPILDKLPS